MVPATQLLDHRDGRLARLDHPISNIDDQHHGRAISTTGGAGFADPEWLSTKTVRRLAVTAIDGQQSPGNRLLTADKPDRL